VVAVAAAWSTWSLRATLVPVAYLDDASMHEQMVRYATRSIASGRLPLTGWFPYLGEGSPQFLHYQSLGAMVTGLAGTVVGADTAFRWSLLLLVGLWPIAVYGSARILGLGPWTSAAAAAMSPLLVSVPAVGYERGAYVWVGYGLWAQLWASWTLPFAWACTWRALDDRRYLSPAALMVALTIAFHFETGCLALMAVVMLPFLVPSRLRVRLTRASVLFGASVAAAAWALVPLVVYGKWAAINEVLAGTPLENGYGARQILRWLVTGQVYDAGRFPVVSVLAAVGMAVAVYRWRTVAWGRALIVLWGCCLVLAFGRTTFGPLVNVIPFAGDLFFRRFLMGSQLAGLLLAGVGLATLGRGTVSVVDRSVSFLYDSDRDRAIGRYALLGLVAVAVGALLLPAIREIGAYDEHNATSVAQQHAGESVSSRDIDLLISYIERHGGGRTYAGLPDNWGSTFTVAMVPVFKYLESKDVDEVGYTLRTASLMTDPEYYFDEDDPGDYRLFGVRYLVYPSGTGPPIPATEIGSAGPYALWRIADGGYLDVVDTVGVIAADRADIATRSLPLLRSTLAIHHQDDVVSFAGAPAPELTVPSGRATSPADGPGTVLSGPKDLTAGTARGVVRMLRPGVVLLSASFDPGWRATVDGRPAPVQMLAPALVGVAVGTGTHRVEFTYQGFAYYPELLLLAGLVLVALFLVTRRPGRRVTPTE